MWQKLRKKTSMYTALLVSNLLILLMFAALSMLANSIYYNALRKQTEVYNTAMLDQAQIILDERLRTVEQIAASIYTDPDTQSALNIGATLDGSERYEIYRLNLLLGNSCQADPTIDSAYIYLKKSNLIVSNLAAYDADDFYSQAYHYQDWSEDVWRARLSDRCFMTLEPEQAVMRNSTRINVISAFFSLPLGLNDSSQGMLVISLNSSILKNYLKDINVLIQGAVFVTSD